jgi:Erv1 / Alr family
MTKTLKKYMKNKRKTSKVYKRSDYLSNDGMLTTVWGPSTWHLLHTMSFNYPVNPTCSDKQNYRAFVLNLQNVLPCGKCRKNLKKNFKKLPLTWKCMENRDKFSMYVYKLHELINKMLNKNSGLSYDDVRERYEHFRARCAKTMKEFEKEKKELVKENKEGEKGCTEPLYGEKSKCILKIVPQDTKCETFSINDKCIKKKLDK